MASVGAPCQWIYYGHKNEKKWNRRKKQKQLQRKREKWAYQSKCYHKPNEEVIKNENKDSQRSKKVTKLIKLRKKRKTNEASQSIMLLQAEKKVIKDKGKKKPLMTKKLIEWRKKSKWGFSINNVITRSKGRRLSAATCSWHNCHGGLKTKLK